jgi:hypothetical protein
MSLPFPGSRLFQQNTVDLVVADPEAARKRIMRKKERRGSHS